MKMEAEQSLMLVVLSELMYSDDEKPTRGKTRPWVKRRSVSGYFKMELSATKANRESLTFVTESPTADSTGVVDTPPDVLKRVLRITIKIK